MPSELKNTGATYQRLVDTIFEGQIGRNLEAYVDDMVIKNKTEQDLLKDIEETLLTLKKQPETNAMSEWQTCHTKHIFIKGRPPEKSHPRLDTLKKCTNKKDFRWTEVAEEAFQSIKKLIAELPTLTAPMKDEELLVYLSAASKAVSAVLLVERRGRQMPIHYNKGLPNNEEMEEADDALGVVKFTNEIKEIAYKMPYKIEQYDSLSDMEKENTNPVYFRNEEDKRKGVVE
ncbi:reverse transcriptase domain-containing protein [Tanacetum coccineum]